MTDFAALLQPDKGQAAQTIYTISKDGFDEWLNSQSERVRSLVNANRFTAKPGELVIIPGENGIDWSVVVGAAKASDVWHLANVAGKLPSGTYRLADGAPSAAALGWLLTHHHFTRYLAKPEVVAQRILLTSEPASTKETILLAEATALARDLVNTPAADLGPTELAAAAEAIAKTHDAKFSVTKGADLESGYPMIYAVGMAADKKHAPRLIEIEWGNSANPRIAIIGKGITFDSGGLNIKPGNSMRLMKKDMGGAAHALALAKLIMDARLPVRLHLLIAAAENSIAGNAFRPGDVLKSRNGMTVEIDNTDAEGRLVLADAITRACEDSPAVMIDFATLTGAARVALGPDLPAFFSNNDDLAAAFAVASQAVNDPLWRLPLWAGYDDMLNSDIADCVNSSEGGFAGSITAALFLNKFVTACTPWAHFDTFAWRPSAKPGRPKGGDALGLRAAYEVIKTKFPPL